MLAENFVYLGLVLGILGGVIYLVDVIRGGTQPNRVTFALWSVAPLVAFFAQLSEGVGRQAILSLTTGLVPLTILIASFLVKNAYWQLHRSDYAFAGLAVLMIIVWQVTGKGLLAIVFAIVVDGLASIPTVVKSYRFPETENALGYGFPSMNAAIVLLTVTDWRFEEYGFPLYLLLIAMLLFSLTQFKIGNRVKARPSRLSVG